MNRTQIIKLAVCFSMLFLMANTAKSQWRIAGGINVLSTPFFENVPKYKLGAEVNYFMKTSFALTGGVELNEKDLGVSAGVRYYPIDPVFLRMRGILSDNTELALGMGYAIKLNKKLRVETMADYFAVNNDFAVRIGLGLGLN